MQSVSSRIWTRVAVSISYDDNHYKSSIYTAMWNVIRIHISEHNQTMTNFNERMNTLLYKNIISHTLFSKGWCCCVWEMSRWRGQTAILTPSSSRDHSSTSFSSWLGCLTVGHWGPWAFSLQADSHAGILSSTDSNRLCPGYIIVYVHLLPLFFRLFTQVHLLIDGSVEGQSITIGFKHGLQTTAESTSSLSDLHFV